MVILPAEEQEEQQKRQDEEEARMKEAGLLPIKDTVVTAPEAEEEKVDEATLPGKQTSGGSAGLGSQRGEDSFRVSRRLQGLLPELSVVGALVVGYSSEDE